MFDCGNSRRCVIKKERKSSSTCSVSSSVSNDYLRSRHHTKRYNDHDLLYSLLEDLRYSGRAECTEDRYRKYEKAYESRKASRTKCIKQDPSLTLDGGTSLSQYTKGPVIDLGSSEKNPGTSSIQEEGACGKDAQLWRCPGKDFDCDDKIIFDGGTA
jgi:hypothetical protein